MDLNESKAEIILKHGTILFVADEVYKAREFLRKLEGVYPVSELNLKTLDDLAA